MDKKVIVKQNGENDCASACLLSIMRYYGANAILDEISYVIRVSNDGANAYNLINGARYFGFDGYGIHYSYEEIISNNITFPIICHVLKNNMYHFLVIYAIKKNNLIVMDPSSDIHKISKEQFKSIYLGSSIVIYPVKKFNSLKEHKKLTSLILDYLKPSEKETIKTIILSFLVIFISIIINYYVLICLDYILPNYNINYLIKITILFGIFYLLKSILDYIKNNFIINIEKDISIKLNKDVIIKLFNLPYQFFKNKSTGDVMNRVNDIKAFKDLIINIVSNISINIILILMSSIILIIINSKLFIINLISLIIYFIIVKIYKSIFTKQIEEILDSESIYNKTLNENINGYESNKNINMINYSIKKIEIDNNKNIHKYNSYEKTLNKQVLWKDILLDLTYIITVFISIIYINNKTLSIGEFYMFNSILVFFKDPLKSILDLEPSINYIKNIYNRINDILVTNNIKDGEVIDNIKGNINVYDLSYSPDGLNNIFENVSFNIKYGSKFLLYGNSGNGKSTIMKILLKYLKDYNGEIYIGNINLKDINEESISNNMTYVSQHSYIFNDTLKNNIIMDRDISYKEYEKVINICNLNKFRNSKKLRNNFIIEDNGFNISGGERQKIVLARSLLKESNYIILDEALSEVGFNEEKEIMNKIFEYFKDKTIIYISHKKEIIDMFDLKFKLERRKGHDSK